MGDHKEEPEYYVCNNCDQFHGYGKMIDNLKQQISERDKAILDLRREASEIEYLRKKLSELEDEVYSSRWNHGTTHP